MKRRKLSAADYRATLDAFLPPSDCDTNHEEPMTAKLRPIFEQQAKARQKQHGGTAPGKKSLPENLPEVKDARDAAGEALNVSTPENLPESRDARDAAGNGREIGCGKFATPGRGREKGPANLPDHETKDARDADGKTRAATGELIHPTNTAALHFAAGGKVTTKGREMIPSPEAQQFVSTVNALCERYRVPHAAADIAVNAVDLDDAQRMIVEAQQAHLQKLVEQRDATHRYSPAPDMV